MAGTKYIDLNCDMGESYGRWKLGADEEIMPYITSANVACGYHGGDPHVMRATVALAMRHNVAVGAHPSLPDLMGFGRRVMDVTPQEVKDYLCYQTGALREFVRVAGGDLQHMKPHGILYNMMERDEALAVAAGEATLESGGTNLILMAMATGKCDRAWCARGVRRICRSRLRRRVPAGLAEDSPFAHHRSGASRRAGSSNGGGG